MNEAYDVILADPPWAYRNKRTGGSMISGASQKYPTMSVEEICALPIGEIAARDSVLFLWVTTPMMEEGLQVMRAWRFKYKTKIYWRKIMSLGMGFWFNSRNVAGSNTPNSHGKGAYGSRNFSLLSSFLKSSQIRFKTQIFCLSYKNPSSQLNLFIEDSTPFLRAMFKASVAYLISFFISPASLS